MGGSCWKLQSRFIRQFCNRIHPQAYLNNCVFVSIDEFSLRFTLFQYLYKYQFVINRSSFLTIQLKMCLKTVGSQIHRRRLDVYAMKIGFPTVEMFWTIKMILFWANVRVKCRDKIKNSLRLKNQLMKWEFYIGDWSFEVLIVRIR